MECFFKSLVFIIFHHLALNLTKPKVVSNTTGNILRNVYYNALMRAQ